MDNPYSPGAPRGFHYEDFAIGMVMEPAARTVTEADILIFAGHSGDFTPIHMDDNFARASIYGERIAHGLMGLVFAQGLISMSGMPGSPRSVGTAGNSRRRCGSGRRCAPAGR